MKFSLVLPLFCYQSLTGVACISASVYVSMGFKGVGENQQFNAVMTIEGHCGSLVVPTNTMHPCIEAQS